MKYSYNLICLKIGWEIIFYVRNDKSPPSDNTDSLERSVDKVKILFEIPEEN